VDDSGKARLTCDLFFFEGYLGVSPTMANLARILDREGYAVTVYGTQSAFPTAPTIGADSTAVLMRGPMHMPGARLAWGSFRRLGLSSAAPFVQLVPYLVTSAANASRARPKPTARIAVGVDTNGAITALVHHWLTGTPFAFLSLELRDPKSFRGLARLINLLERRAYRDATVVIVPDKDRFETLGRFQNYTHPQVVFLPNSPLRDESESATAEKSNLLRARLGIDANEFPVIALQAGMIDSAMYSDELAKAFLDVDSGVAFVLHERIRRDSTEPFMQQLRAINHRNLFLSLDPVPLEDLDQVFRSATIGLAFYRDIDENYSQIAMASGKLGYYLKHGKPVLVSSNASMSNFIDRTGVGIVISDPGNSVEVRDAIRRIVGNYDTYSAKARACYEREFDFGRNVQPLLSIFRGMHLAN
jgi:hypothetical protein